MNVRRRSVIGGVLVLGAAGLVLLLTGRFGIDLTGRRAADGVASRGGARSPVLPTLTDADRPRPWCPTA